MRLAPGDVHVWFQFTGGFDPSAIGGAVSALSADERARHDRLYFAHDRRDYACAHALLRTVLSRYLDREPRDLQFETNAHGRPSLPAQAASLSFNLSHSAGLVACAVSETFVVGIDVEPLDRKVDIERVAERFFAPAEIAQLAARDDIEARTRLFFELWTLKESWIKALGTGLSQPLDHIAFTRGETDGIAVAFPAPAGGPWWFALFAPEPRFRLAVSAAGGAVPPRLVARAFDGAADAAPLPPIAASRGVG